MESRAPLPSQFARVKIYSTSKYDEMLAIRLRFNPILRWVVSISHKKPTYTSIALST